MSASTSRNRAVMGRFAHISAGGTGSIRFARAAGDAPALRIAAHARRKLESSERGHHGDVRSGNVQGLRNRVKYQYPARELGLAAQLPDSIMAGTIGRAASMRSPDPPAAHPTHRSFMSFQYSPVAPGCPTTIEPAAFVVQSTFPNKQLPILARNLLGLPRHGGGCRPDMRSWPDHS